MKIIQRLCLLCCSLLLTACAMNNPPDYTAFRNSDPKSILILPPINESTEVGAEESVYSALLMPVAEAGYYPIPIALTKEFFKSNGLTEAFEIQNLPLNKLHDVFGADAVLYLTINQFGSKYQVIQSVTTVTLSGKLLDSKTGDTLWAGAASAMQQSGGSGLGAIIGALISQVIDSATNRSHTLSVQAGFDLISPHRIDKQGWLFGPRSPNYRKDTP